MTRLKIAIQKSGRLTQKCLNLLSRAGLDFPFSKTQLRSSCSKFPADLLLVRDDDIPEYLNSGVCDLGFVGLNLLEEKKMTSDSPTHFKILSELGFGQCRLSLAAPIDITEPNLEWFNGKRIATSYPATLKQFCDKKGLNISILEVSGSVEITPSLGIADGVCDIVSTGGTLKANGLKESLSILQSQCVVAQGEMLDPEKQPLIDKLINRLQGVLFADRTRYVMMNVPKNKVNDVCKILPSMEAPSIMELSGHSDMVAVHVASSEDILWNTMEQLKELGANSVLVLPIEKVI